MRKMLRSFMWLLAFAGLFSVSAPAFGTTLTAGSTVAPNVQTGTFTTLANTGPLAFTMLDGTAGTMQELVGHFGANPFGSSDLTFIFQVKVTAGDVSRLTGFNFAGFQTDVGMYPNGPLGAGNQAPISADRSTDAKTVGFNFAPQLVPGKTSYMLIVNTDATAWTPGLFSVIDGATVTNPGFAPTTAVPEFGSASLMGLMLVGFTGIFGVRRFRMPAMV